MTCGACGYTNPAATKFCGECGQRLASSTASAEDSVLEGRTRLETPEASRDILAGRTTGLTRIGSTVDGDAATGRLQAGALIDDRYMVVKLIGRGGMGAVYEVIDTQTERTRALKLLHPAHAGRKELVASLSREVALASDVQHPNLVTVHHFERRTTVPYIVMELLHGDLDEHLRARGGQFEEPDAVRVVDGILAGLEALHGQRIAHLDVKPQNVLIAKDGTPKLADFGISRTMREQRTSGTGAGTLEYAAPEQWRAESADVRADIYAVGIILHQLVTGDLPFEKSPEAARSWHEKARREFPRLSPNLASFVAKCTAVLPDARFRTARSARDALIPLVLGDRHRTSTDVARGPAAPPAVDNRNPFLAGPPADDEDARRLREMLEGFGEPEEPDPAGSGDDTDSMSDLWAETDTTRATKGPRSESGTSGWGDLSIFDWGEEQPQIGEWGVAPEEPAPAPAPTVSRGFVRARWFVATAVTAAVVAAYLFLRS